MTVNSALCEPANPPTPIDMTQHATKPVSRSTNCSSCTSIRGQLAASQQLVTEKNQQLATVRESFHRSIDRVAHHLRTPLTVVKQFAAMMDDGLAGPLSEQQEEFVGKILIRSDDLAFALDDLLDIGRLEAGALSAHRRRNQVPEMLARAKLLLDRRAQSRELNLRVVVPGELPMVYCDEVQVQRAVVNLALNAIAFAPDGSDVELWARPICDHPTSQGKFRGVSIGITDQGPVIAQPDLDELFAQFSRERVSLQTCEQSSEMALRVAKELIHLNLGTLHAASSETGNAISFTLPAHDPQSLLASFLNRSLDQFASLISVEITDTDEFSAAPVIDDFLQTNVGSDKLVFQCNATRWMVVACCSANELDDWLNSLTSAWSEYMSICPLGNLPEPEMTPLGTWRVSDLRTGHSCAAGASDWIDKLVARLRDQQTALEGRARIVNPSAYRRSRP